VVNAYEMKAGMVCLQCKNCVIDGMLYKSRHLLQPYASIHQAV